MATAADALRAATQRLASHEAARLEAELLMAHALGMTRGDMLLRVREIDAPQGYDALVARRVAGEPVAHIIGERDFWTLRLRVTPDVLIPRPDSEVLIEAAIEHFGAGAGPASVLDLGVGSGALLLAALDHWPRARGLGVDRSAAALQVAQDNAARCAMAERAAFALGDWGEGLNGRFELILCNPPYIAQGFPLDAEVRDHEPHGALFAGADGLDDYRRIAPQVRGLLAPGGCACVEIGYDQGESAAALFRAAGLAVALRRDLAGRDRCLLVTAA